MTVTINGNSIEIEIGESSLGDLLARLDDLVEKAGSVILGLTLDGKPVDPNDLPALRDTPAASYDTLQIDSVPSCELRSRAFETLLDFLQRAKSWTESSDPAKDLQERWENYRETYSGLLSSDEHSFLDMLGRDIESLPGDPPASERQKLIRHTERLEPIFRERLDELTDPPAAMRAASVLYSSERENLKEVPVRLQTGKDAEAMRSILLFIEIFNKANRILPELARTGTDTKNLRIEGKPLPEFYESFNVVLRQLMEAFETKDAVLIGDLAEYEIVPRMNSFFDAVVGALPT